MKIVVALGVALAMATVVKPVFSQCGTEGPKLLPPSTSAGQEAGTAVCQDGDWSFVGAPGVNQNTGAIFVYRYTSGAWSYSQTLTAPSGDANTNDAFGTKLALTSSHLFVSAPKDDEAVSPGDGVTDDEGAVYVYRRESQAFFLEAKLMPSEGDPFNFGASISAWDDTVLIGEPNGEMAAYVFRKTGTQWGKEAFIQPTGDPGVVVEFGASVALYQNVAVIGDYRYEGKFGVKSGAAFVCRRTGTAWSSPVRIDHPGHAFTASADDHFGEAAAIYGRWLFIGAPTLGSDVAIGSVFAFRENATGSFEEQGVVLPDDLNDFDLYGSSLSVRGNQLMVGSPAKEHPITGHESGAAYLFRNEGGVWIQATAGLMPADAQNLDEFGFDVYQGSLAIVGSRRADLSSPLVINVGAAYLWQPCP